MQHEEWATDEWEGVKPWLVGAGKGKPGVEALAEDIGRVVALLIRNGAEAGMCEILSRAALSVRHGWVVLGTSNALVGASDFLRGEDRGRAMALAIWVRSHERSERLNTTSPASLSARIGE